MSRAPYRGRVEFAYCVGGPQWAAWRGANIVLPRPQIGGVHHVDISVTNLEASTTWYGELLGMVELFSHRSDERGYAVCYLAEPTSGIVMGFEQHDANPGTPFDERRVGLDHLSWTVQSREQLDAWLERLEERQIPTRASPNTRCGTCSCSVTPTMSSSSSSTSSRQLRTSSGTDRGTDSVSAWLHRPSRSERAGIDGSGRNSYTTTRSPSHQTWTVAKSIAGESGVLPPHPHRFDPNNTGVDCRGDRGVDRPLKHVGHGVTIVLCLRRGGCDAHARRDAKVERGAHACARFGGTGGVRRR